ncbi:hypothetical protein RJ55_01947 [Drechmeria coniospora]|nr:hypothetical protein RJ55_01947 [Drechmeria coniospora]
MARTEVSGAAVAEFGFSASQGVHWDEYISFRPVYPPSFFGRIYDYHSTKARAAWSTAHDVGAGCGIVSAQLASRFERVVVSDPNDGYVAVARKMLVDELGLPEAKLTFLQESAEASSLTSGTVDLITAQLKPGGTLVLTHYNVPRIADNEAAQRIWTAIWAIHSTKARGALFDRAFRLCNNGLEGIEFPESEWTSVRRTYINAHGTLDSFKLNDRTGESRVKAGEEKVWEDGDEGWCHRRGIDWLRGYLGTWVPRIPESELQPLWHEMALVLKGERVRIEYPVVMIFATRTGE